MSFIHRRGYACVRRANRKHREIVVSNNRDRHAYIMNTHLSVCRGLSGNQEILRNTLASETLYEAPRGTSPAVSDVDLTGIYSATQSMRSKGKRLVEN